MDIERLVYTIREEPEGEHYRAVINEARRHCDRFTLIQRDGLTMTPSGEAVLHSLNPYLLHEKRVSEWPGTILLDGSARLREYELAPGSAQILETVVQRLYDWVQPSCPEDLAFWRTGDGPWLVTIGHERDGYFQLTTAEYDDLHRTLSNLSLELEREEEER